MKILHRVLTALQIILLGSAATLYYLCQNRMGVARHITYLTRKWQAALNLDILFFALIALFLLCACWLLLRWRRRSQAPHTYMPWLPFLVMSLAVTAFMIAFHKAGLRPYYQLLAIFDTVLLLQLIKSLRHYPGILFCGYR